MLSQVLHDRLNQLADTAKAAGQDRLLAQIAEEALDHIHPGGTGWGKVQFETRMAFQPTPDARMFVSGVIVQNDVDVLAHGDLPVNALEEFEPLAVRVFVSGVGDYFSLQVVERGKEGDRAIAIVIVGLGTNMPFAQRQTGLAALQRLDLAFLVTAKHHRILGRIEVEPDHVPKLRFKVRIGRKLKDPCQMRLDFILAPNPLHGCLGQSQLPSHCSTSPARLTVRRPGGLIEDLPQDSGCNAALTARARLILQSGQPAFAEAPSPLPDLVIVHIDLSADAPIPFACCRQLDHSRPLGQAMRSALGAQQLLQSLLFSRTQFHFSPRPLSHAASEAFFS